MHEGGLPGFWDKSQRAEDQNRECERDYGTRVRGTEDQNRECERDSGTNQWEKGYES